DGKKYLEFTPPHFSPYALYYANAGETPTTQPTTSAQQPTTSNGNGNNNNSTTSYTQATTKALGGSLDNTPNTGVKDVMWILIPAATLLLGVGIVVLARRKKNINDNY
ncbi:MAG: LPXTG cell wall anchor domain-containing protein, partial [Lachnospira sp.]|nr:LPXTG cell wall anchor domain-containing protein [Lachnospira sp.]